MTIRCQSRKFAVLVIALCGVLVDVMAHATTITVANGTFLSENDGGSQILTDTAALTGDFVIGNAPLSFSADLEATADGQGTYIHGLIVGNVSFTIFPGFDDGGALRIGTSGFGNSEITGGNVDMGFNPETEVATISVVLTDAGSGNYSVAVTVSSGTNTFTNGGAAYTIAASDFGGLTNFGVGRDAVRRAAGKNLPARSASK